MNKFSTQSIFRVKIESTSVFIERLNCMPQTPEIFYPGSIFFDYAQICNGIYQSELENLGCQPSQISTTIDKLKEAPSGVSVTIGRT